METEAPRTFRRESRLFLWVALLLILLLNFVMLLFFSQRRGVVEPDHGASGGRDPAPRRAGGRRAVRGDGPRRGRAGRSLPRGVRRARTAGAVAGDLSLEAPGRAAARAACPAGRQVSEWRQRPGAAARRRIASQHRVFVVALDPGPGASLRAYARTLSVIVAARRRGARRARLVLPALAAPALRPAARRRRSGARERPAQGRRRARFRDRALRGHDRGALRERDGSSSGSRAPRRSAPTTWRPSARTLSRNLPTGLLSVDPDGTVVELNESGREILMAPAAVRGLSAWRRCSPTLPIFATAIESAPGRAHARGTAGGPLAAGRDGEGPRRDRDGRRGRRWPLSRRHGALHGPDGGAAARGARGAGAPPRRPGRGVRGRGPRVPQRGGGDRRLRGSGPAPARARGRALEGDPRRRRSRSAASRATSCSSRGRAVSPPSPSLSGRRSRRPRGRRRAHFRGWRSHGPASFRRCRAPRSSCGGRSPTCCATPWRRRRPTAEAEADAVVLTGRVSAAARSLCRWATAAPASSRGSARRSSCRSTRRRRTGPVSAWPSWRASPSCTAARSRSTARPGGGALFTLRLSSGAAEGAGPASGRPSPRSSS